MGKRNTMGGQDIFKYLGYIILYNGNIILRKFGKNIEPALNHVYKLMSNFLLDLFLFSD
jgi:hypothetical protein